MSNQNCPEFAAQTWKQLNEFQLTQRPLVVALSGGLDSMVMLRVMLELRSQQSIEFSAIHINHGLSENAARWQAFVTSYCEINQIPLTVKSLELSHQPRQSLEQIARNARYASMAELLPEHAVIVTGHHLYDQVETFFLRLTRGSSAKGLSAMSVYGDMPNQVGQQKTQSLFRPLLKTPKSQLEAYANSHFLEWVEDESNQDLSFDRNFIRHQVTPILESRWSHLPNAIATSCQILAEESMLLEQYLAADLTQLVAEDRFGFNVLSIKDWQKHSDVKQVQLLRLFLKQIIGLQVSRVQVNEVIKTIINSEPDKQGVINIGRYQIRKYADNLYCLDNSRFLHEQSSVSIEFEIDRERLNQWHAHIPLASALYQQSTLEICLVVGDSEQQGSEQQEPVQRGSKNEDWSLRFGMQSGLKMTPNQNSGRKKVTEFLKQRGCPAWLRDQVPLLFIENELVAVIGFAIDVNWQGQISYKIRQI